LDIDPLDEPEPESDNEFEVQQQQINMAQQ
jgi:hypothetical protein